MDACREEDVPDTFASDESGGTYVSRKSYDVPAIDKPVALLMSMVTFSGLIFVAGLGMAYQPYWSLSKR